MKTANQTHEKQTTRPGRVEELVLCLYEARREAKRTLKLWQEKAAEVGQCEGHNEEDWPCYLQKNHDLCEVCAAKQPFWEARQKASIAAGVALRRVLNAGKLISANVVGLKDAKL